MSSSDAIQRQYEMACRYQAHAHDTLTCLLLDEVGLAEHSPDMPLKVLHSILVHPPIAIIGLSNWALDPAKMNRAVCIRRTEPSPLDIELTAASIVRARARARRRRRRVCVCVCVCVCVPPMPLPATARVEHRPPAELAQVDGARLLRRVRRAARPRFRRDARLLFAREAAARRARGERRRAARRRADAGALPQLWSASPRCSSARSPPSTARASARRRVARARRCPRRRR